MPNYDFFALNDREFEELGRDLLSKELSIRFQSFTTGKDGGLDLRYSTDSNENKIIVQVKHYTSGYPNLKSKIKTEEINKIRRINPSRYIIFTSVKLTPNNKNELMTLCNPHINNTNDIYGRDDINGLLMNHPDIEKKYFKLWFSNTGIIDKIVNSGIINRSAFFEDKIKKNIKLYVVNKSYYDALDIIRENKILLITGIPGVGKTTLAYMISYYILSNDFELIYIDNDIKEAESLIKDDDSKQLFFFDDFLGSNYYELVNNTDKSITNFVERIASSKGKYIILTTRSTIYNQACSTSEKIDRADLKLNKCEINVDDYNDVEKAKILYNHIYESEIEKSYLKELFTDENYWKIIQHKNYNPRLIEFFTRKAYILDLKKEEYLKSILRDLNNPEKIWERAYINQINDIDRCLLSCLLSLGNSVSKNNLELLFNKTIEYEIKNSGLIRQPAMFKNSFRNLLDGYIVNKIYPSSISFVDFINPSLRDYLIQFYNNNKHEKWNWIKSFSYVEQFIVGIKKDNGNKDKIIIFQDEITRFLDLANTSNLLSINNLEVNSMLAFLFSNYRTIENEIYVEKIILDRIEQINWETHIICSYLFHVFKKTDTCSDLSKYLIINWEIIISNIIRSTDSEDDLKELQMLFIKYGKDYDLYLFENEGFEHKINEILSEIYIQGMEGIITLGKLDIRSIEEVEEIKKSIEDLLRTLERSFYDGKDLGFEVNLDQYDWENIILQNIEQDEELEAYREGNGINETNDAVDIINNMFSSFDK